MSSIVSSTLKSLSLMLMRFLDATLEGKVAASSHNILN